MGLKAQGQGGGEGPSEPKEGLCGPWGGGGTRPSLGPGRGSMGRWSPLHASGVAPLLGRRLRLLFSSNC